MEPSFWHKKWASQQIGFHLDEVNPLLVKHWPSLELAKGSQVFVPLCGKSLDLCYLAEQGHDVIACELNQSAVEQFFSDNQLDVTVTSIGEHQCYQTEQVSLYQGDIFSLPCQPLEKVSAFYDRAALIAWPEDMRRQYAQQLANLIPAKSIGLLITLDYPQQALSGPPFAISHDWVMKYLGNNFEVTRLSCEEVLHENPRFINNQVPWLTESVYRLQRF